MKLYKIASLCVAGFFIVGCGNSMPSCTDKEVKDLLTQIVEKHYKKQFGRASGDLEFSFSGFSTNRTNENRKEVTCEVTIDTMHAKTGENEEDTIHYTARHTDDGKLLVKVTEWED